MGLELAAKLQFYAWQSTFSPAQSADKFAGNCLQILLSSLAAITEVMSVGPRVIITTEFFFVCLLKFVWENLNNNHLDEVGQTLGEKLKILSKMLMKVKV